MIVTLCSNHIPLRSYLPNLFLLSCNKISKTLFIFFSSFNYKTTSSFIKHFQIIFLQIKQGNKIGMFIISSPPKNDSISLFYFILIILFSFFLTKCMLMLLIPFLVSLLLISKFEKIYPSL
jgi:hypothetical protein